MEGETGDILVTQGPNTIRDHPVSTFLFKLQITVSHTIVRTARLKIPLSLEQCMGDSLNLD